MPNLSCKPKKGKKPPSPRLGKLPMQELRHPIKTHGIEIPHANTYMSKLGPTHLILFA